MNAIYLVGLENGPITIHRTLESAEQHAGDLAPRGNVEFWQSRPLDSADEARMRCFILRDSLQSDGLREQEDGWHLPWKKAVLCAIAATCMKAGKPPMSDHGKALTQFRTALGMESSTIAAMLGVSRTKAWRLETGESKLSLSEWATLCHWAKRLDRMAELKQAFANEEVL